MKEYNILIIEDEEELLSIYVNYATQIFTKVITANKYQKAKQILAKQHIDCLLVDNKLPDGLGISIIKELNNKEANIPIVMITGYADKELAIESVNLGVFYFLEKPVGKNQIIETLQKCYDFLIESSKYKEIENFYLLTNQTIIYLKEKYNITDRELELIPLALRNYKNPAIAEKLFITTGTVKRHLHNIFEKMNITTKEELQLLIHEMNTLQNC